MNPYHKKPKLTITAKRFCKRKRQINVKKNCPVINAAYYAHVMQK